MARTAITAHRGLTEACTLENTMSAFEKAIELGVDEIELDVHLTKDGEVVVIHDETVDRTTNGKGYIRDKTIDELKNLRIIDKNGTLHTDEQIPKLDEVLQLISEAEYPLRLNIELKTDEIPYEGIVDKVVGLVENHMPKDRVRFSSFNHETLEELKQKYDAYPVAPLFLGGIKDSQIQDAIDQLKAEAVHMDHVDLTKERLAYCHREGLHVRVYTVNEEEDIKRCLGLKVDGVITDDPERAMELRRQDRSAGSVLRAAEPFSPIVRKETNENSREQGDR